jgi:mono/diheme cytochrome c family protein
MNLCAAALGIAAAVAVAQDAGQPPAQAPAAGAQQQGGRGGRGGRGGGGGAAYPQHAPGDPAAIGRGQQIFSINCTFCHGSDARGGEGGPNLIRSQLVMDDQNGEAIAVVVQNGRPDRGMPKFDLTTAQVSDVAAYIHSLYISGHDPSRDVPTNILVGDAKAGEEFFNGPVGKCNTCHSVTGDLAGIGSKMDAKTLQNTLVSGGGGRGRGGPSIELPPTTVKVTLTSGKTYEGNLTHLDDFLVSLTDGDGNHLSFDRKGDEPKIEVHNPLQAHLDLLSKYTDDQIHNLTAYLVTIK